MSCDNAQRDITDDRVSRDTETNLLIRICRQTQANVYDKLDQDPDSDRGLRNLCAWGVCVRLH